MSGCEYETKSGLCTLNECLYGDFLLIDDSMYESGKYCYATCEEYKKAKEKMQATREDKNPMCLMCSQYFPNCCACE